MLKYLIDIPNVLLQTAEAVQLITIFLIVYKMFGHLIAKVLKTFQKYIYKPIKHQKWMKNERNKIQMEFHLPKRYSHNEY